MRNVRQFICFVSGALAFVVTQAKAEPAAEKTGPRIDNTVQMVLLTLFKGDVEKTKTTVEDFSDKYKHFLSHFVEDDYCKSNIEIIDGCAKFQEQENDAILAKTWLRGFRFGKAEFRKTDDVHNFGIYNLEKIARVSRNFTCVITLQMTADLSNETLINKEFIVVCEER